MIQWFIVHSGRPKDSLTESQVTEQLALGGLAKGLKDSRTEGLTACLADWVPGSKAFPHVLLHGAFQLGNAASSLHIVYSVEPSRGSEAPLHLYTRPETPLLRPPLISNRDFLSRSLASPFSRSFTPTDMLVEAILKELTDVGWFAPGFLTLPEWCIWCGVYSALINV